VYSTLLRRLAGVCVRKKTREDGRSARKRTDALRDGGDGGRGGGGGEGNGKARGEKEREKRSGVSGARRGWAFRADSIALDFRSRAGKTWPYRAGEAPTKLASETRKRERDARLSLDTFSSFSSSFLFSVSSLFFSPFFSPLFFLPSLLFSPREINCIVALCVTRDT